MSEWDVHKIKGVFEREKRRLVSYPLNTYFLNELEIKDYYVRLSNDQQLILKSEDINRLKRAIPRFLHEKLKIPLLIHITLNPKCRFEVKGDTWQIRVIEMLIRNRISWQPDACLSENEFIEAIKMLGSLVHVSFSDINMVWEYEELEE